MKISLSIASLRTWRAARWLVAAAAAFVVLLLLAIPTALIETPWFSREIAPTWWAWPVAIATAVVTGLLLASYVAAAPAGSEARPAGIGGVLAFFAIGCPVCNKIVLLALGTGGAMTWFAPAQPILAIVALLLVGWALLRRLRGEVVCDLPRA